MITLTLITGRSLSQGLSKEIGKTSKTYKENVAVCELDPKDLEALKISAGTNIHVFSEHGDVVVKALLSTQLPHEGIAFLPCGPWANALFGFETNGTGMPSFKGIKANVVPAPDEMILDVRELLEKNYGT